MQKIEFDNASPGSVLTEPAGKIENLSGNLPLMVPVAVIVSIIYYLTNHLHWREPLELPLLALDHQIPFLMWTVWPYLLLLTLTLLLVVAEGELFHRSLMAVIIGTILNAAWWILLPTTYPRPPVPAVEDLTSEIYQWLCSVDSPANCFPSAHITLPAIAFHAIAAQHARLRWWLMTVFALLSVTIFTTKQHYVIDLPGGLMTAWLAVRLSEWADITRNRGSGS
jgi:hypothetical protein